MFRFVAAMKESNPDIIRVVHDDGGRVIEKIWLPGMEGLPPNQRCLTCEM